MKYKEKIATIIYKLILPKISLSFLKCPHAVGHFRQSLKWCHIF